MSKLTNVPHIDQSKLALMYSFAIRSEQNVLVLGPSGAGKTEMAFQAAEEAGRKAIYWNMSTMERPDIQGVPVISDDKQTVKFAAQEGLPFSDLRFLKEQRDIENALGGISALEQDYNVESIKNSLTQKLSLIKKNKAIAYLNNVRNVIGTNDLLEAAEDTGEKFVLLLDEIDKSPPENLQPLLELLLYRTINGRPLNIQSIIMTGNLPDEQTYAEPLSHALTNRAMIFELVPDINIWLKWGRNNDLHPLVLGFLSKEENAAEFFNKRPKNNQMYTYAYPSPRSWTRASNTVYKYDAIQDDMKHLLVGDTTPDDVRELILSSIVGQEASEKLNVWFNYYQQYDGLIEAVFNGKRGDAVAHPSEMDALFVCSVALTHKFLSFAKNKDTDETSKVHEKAHNVFSWITSSVVPADVRVCAMRSAYDNDVYIKHGLEDLPITANVFAEVVNMLELVQGKDNEILEEKDEEN